jgi:hypothetical protein
VGEALEGRFVSRTSIRRVAVAWTAAMTAAGAIVGINVGVHKLSQPGTASATQASVVELSRDAEVAQLQALQASKVAAAEQQVAMARAAQAARQKAAAAAKAQAEAKAKAEAKAAAAKAARAAAERDAARARDAERSTRSQDRTPIRVEPGSAKDIARQMVRARGWSDAEFNCLVKLWDRESGWRVNASNPSTPAYGIPQANPGRKMASAGADWRTNPRTQITWGLGYISSRYDRPCGAWSHFRSSGWY